MILSDRGGRRRRKGGDIINGFYRNNKFSVYTKLAFLSILNRFGGIHPCTQSYSTCWMRLPSPFSLPANCWKNLSNPLEAGRHCTVNRTTFYNKKKKEGVLRSNATLLPPFSINWKASMLRLKFTKRVRWLRQIGTCWSSRAWNPTGYETQQEREDFFFPFKSFPSSFSVFDDSHLHDWISWRHFFGGRGDDTSKWFWFMLS